MITTIDGIFLHTQQLRVLLVNEDSDEIEKIKAKNDPGTLAATIVDLCDVTAVAQSVDNNGEVNDDQCILMYGSEEVTIESPYHRVAIAWTEAKKAMLNV